MNETLCYIVLSNPSYVIENLSCCHLDRQPGDVDLDGTMSRGYRQLDDDGSGVGAVRILGSAEKLLEANDAVMVQLQRKHDHCVGSA